MVFLGLLPSSPSSKSARAAAFASSPHDFPTPSVPAERYRDMSKRSVFTTISPLPAGVSREVVIEFLHNHVDMIDLNPLVIERHPIDPPPSSSPYEKDCVWYSLTDKIDYLPGGKVSGDISYTCAFHDLANGIQTHCRAPLGVDIRDKWTLNGSLPGEPPEPAELGIGAPATGLYIREDVDLRCNVLMTSFVKKNLKRSHATLVDTLVEKAKHASAARRSINAAGASPPQVTQTMSPPSSPPAQQSPQTRGPRESLIYSSRSAHSLLQDGLLGTMSPPPQVGGSLGFVQGPQHRRMPSVRSSGPYENSMPTTTPPPHDLPKAQARAQSQILLHSQCPPLLRAPIQAPLAPYRTTAPPRSPPAPTYAAPAAPRPERCSYYPAPLRIHNPSAGGPRAPTPDASLGSGGSVRSVPSSLATTTTRGSRRSSLSDFEHPDYPHLSPYSSENFSVELGSSPDEPQSPWAPPLAASVGGKGHVGPAEAAIDHPAVLRPGGISGRLSGPFIAELE